MSGTRTTRTLVLAFLVTTAFALDAGAQVTEATVTIGGPGSLGSTGSSPALLSDSTAAEALVELNYDAATSLLTMTVTNTSPVTCGVSNPIINRIFLNLPCFAVDSAVLISQSAPSGPAPSFDLAVDADTMDGQGNLTAGPFGRFGMRLKSWKIANAAADTVSGDPQSISFGPVTFEIELGGPGLSTISAGDIASSYSQSASVLNRNVVLKFIHGGVNANGSGHITDGAMTTPGSGAGLVSRPGGWIAGDIALNETVKLVLSGRVGSHGCLVVSNSADPVQYMGYTVPIGLPVLAAIVADFIPSSSFVARDVNIPDVPSLVGQSWYFVSVLLDPWNPTVVEFSQPFGITVAPGSGGTACPGG